MIQGQRSTIVGGATTIKTYGDALDKLRPYLEEAYKHARTNHYSQPDYLRIRSLLLHKAYQKFCEDHLPLGQCYTTTFYALREHVEKYQMRTTLFGDLFYTLPDEFNVRGRWTKL